MRKPQKMPTTISFSGGRTSGKMLWDQLQLHGGKLPDSYRVLFENTGKERDETLDFVHEVETRWGVPIVWLEYTHATLDELDAKWKALGQESYWRGIVKRIKRKDVLSGETPYHDFKVVSYETAHRNGQPNGPFDKLLSWVSAMPNVEQRSCTAFLKIKTADKYLCAHGWSARMDLIGIRADESHRCLEIRAKAPKRITPRFPLVEDGTCEQDVLDFWESQPFDLQLASYEGNCDLCFLKSQGKLLRLIRERPRAAKWWAGQEAAMETRLGGRCSGSRFRDKREGYASLAKTAALPLLFDELDEEDIPCACTEGGYRYLDEEE